VNLNQAAQLLDWRRMVFDAQFHVRIYPGAVCRSRGHDQDSSALLAANIPSGSLASFKGGYQAFSEISFGLAVSARHCRPNFRRSHHICLHRKTIPDLMTGIGHTVRPGVRRYPAMCIYHSHLAQFPALVGGEQGLQRISRWFANPHQ
jgi:hypothetical protein